MRTAVWPAAAAAAGRPLRALPTTESATLGICPAAGNVTLTPDVLAQFFQLPIVIEPNATVLVHAPGEAWPAATPVLHQRHAIGMALDGDTGDAAWMPPPHSNCRRYRHAWLAPPLHNMLLLPTSTAAANTSGRVAIDWGSSVGVIEVSPGATLAFDQVVSQHPAPCA